VTKEGIDIRFDRYPFEARDRGDVVSDTTRDREPGASVGVFAVHDSRRRAQSLRNESKEHSACLFDLEMRAKGTEVLLGIR